MHHRDVKPGNVLLRPDGAAVLTDFGIAALIDETRLTGTGQVVGSPEFMAPERLRGEPDDPASDLYSLGMLMFVAVDGHSPLRRSSPSRRCRRSCTSRRRFRPTPGRSNR
ncbi:hypothetical protein GCM10025872_17720 [Barrientosiimonas endolithica]|uniref:Protein kinase domain-containing protein n=1 Tax=Barrientosiimonas endolithica TaxID=1535208 RepID=A0ABM8HB41_9MICO|nr:hypothetical protein GCM10025872_17720 [Barrientosiimonas endolithica]